MNLCHTNYILPLSGSFQVGDIFLNWETLIQLHESTLKKLPLGTINSKNIDYASVYKIFQSLLSSIVDTYIIFCSHQRESIRLFTAKMASDIRFRQLVNECQRNLVRILEPPIQTVAGESSGSLSLDQQKMSRITRNLHLPLNSYLLKPMQRITKYSLLFERIEKVSKHQSDELRASTRLLKELAQSLCNQVNEACRSKEDNESNKRKLQWCQSHLVQSEGSTMLQHRLSDPMSSTANNDSFRRSQVDEMIIFDSKTNCMGERRYIKSGSLMKQRSTNKELVLFLFNDLLLVTKVKSYGPPLKVNDVFASDRAQQSYYKFYQPPMLLEDIVLLSTHDTQEQSTPSPSPSPTSRSSWNGNQLLSISFSDRSTGNVHSLLAMDEQEKLNWNRELSQRPMEAREARARQQAQQLARTIRRPNLLQCYARLFVTVLELIGDGNCLASLVRGGRVSAIKVCVQMQTRRVRTVLIDLLEDRKDTTICPTSDIFKTVPVKLNTPQPSEFDSLPSLTNTGCLARFNEECTQFLIENKCATDGPDYLDVGLIDGSKYRECLLIARRKVNLDHLICLDASKFKQENAAATERHSFSRLRPDRPSEFVFKMKPIGIRSLSRTDSIQSTSSIGQRQSVVDRHPSTEITSDLSIKLRFHLQLFST